MTTGRPTRLRSLSETIAAADRALADMDRTIGEIRAIVAPSFDAAKTQEIPAEVVAVVKARMQEVQS